MPGIGRAAGSLGAAALATALVGFAKEIVVAHRFGASSPVDAFLVAFLVVISIPALAVPALQVWFTPTFISRRLEDLQQGNRLYSSAVNLLAAGLFLCGLVIFLISGLLTGAVAPGFDQETRAVLLRLTRILMPVLLFYGVNELLKHAMFCVKTFFVPAMTQGIPPALGILGIFLGSDRLAIENLAYGWVAGTIIQTILLLWVCRRQGLRWTFSFEIDREQRRDLLRTSLPYLPVQVAFVVPLLVDRFFASQLGSGAVSLVNYAQQIFRMPILVISSATFAAAFPFLSEQAAKGKTSELTDSVTETLHKLSFLLLPLTVFLIVLRQEIVMVVYYRGAFSGTDVAQTAEVLTWFVLGLAPHATSLLLDRALCAIRAAPALMRIMVVVLGVKIVGAAVLSRWMGAAGLALSSTVMLTVWAILALLALRARVGRIEMPRILWPLTWAAGSAMVMGGVVLLTLPALPLLGAAMWDAILRLGWGAAVFLAGGVAARSFELRRLTIVGRSMARRSHRRP